MGVLYRSLFPAFVLAMSMNAGADPIVTEPFLLDVDVAPATLPDVGANVTLSWENVGASGNDEVEYMVFSNGMLIAQVETTGFQTTLYGAASYNVVAMAAGVPVARSNIVMAGAFCDGGAVDADCVGELKDDVWHIFFHCAPVSVGVVWVVPDASCINDL